MVRIQNSGKVNCPLGKLAVPNVVRTRLDARSGTPVCMVVTPLVAQV